MDKHARLLELEVEIKKLKKELHEEFVASVNTPENKVWAEKLLTVMSMHHMLFRDFRTQDFFQDSTRTHQSRIWSNEFLAFAYKVRKACEQSS
jgi:hypothetical protein